MLELGRHFEKRGHLKLFKKKRALFESSEGDNRRLRPFLALEDQEAFGMGVFLGIV